MQETSFSFRVPKYLIVAENRGSGPVVSPDEPLITGAEIY